MKFYAFGLLIACASTCSDSEQSIQEKQTASQQHQSRLNTKPKTAEQHSKEKTQKCLTGCGICCGLTAIVALLTCGSCSGNCI